jgi:hypothetical protein
MAVQEVEEFSRRLQMGTRMDQMDKASNSAAAEIHSNPLAISLPNHVVVITSSS